MIEVIKFAAEDVITASCNCNGPIITGIKVHDVTCPASGENRPELPKPKPEFPMPW